MIIDYGFSIVGKSHMTSSDCCQDSHLIRRTEDGRIIAAVADGVGSAKNSHIGSKIAVNTAVKFCCEYMPYDHNLISTKSMLRTAYNYAFKQILREAEKHNQPIESYDTTLTLAIYDGKRIIYGHSGDGAIIGLTSFGDYVEITRVQKGEDSISVLPLRSGYTKWVIDSYEEDLCSVMLLTDGMFETICPYLLRDTQNNKTNVYVPLASFFADFSDLKRVGENTINSIKIMMLNFITAGGSFESENFYNRLHSVYKQHIGEAATAVVDKIKVKNFPISLMQNQQDDKTIVVLANTDIPLDKKEKEFYSEPEWDALQEAWNKKAYPHLYNTEHNEVEENFSDSDIIFNSNIDGVDVNFKQDIKICDDTELFESEKEKTLTGIDMHLKNQTAIHQASNIKLTQKNYNDNIENPQSIENNLGASLKSSNETTEEKSKKSIFDKIGDFFEK